MAPKTFAAASNDFSVVLTPAHAFIIIGKTAEITIIVICIFIVNPRNRINKGTRAILGSEAIAQTYGLKIVSIYLLPPIKRPLGIPITHAIPNPIIRFEKL